MPHPEPNLTPTERSEVRVTQCVHSNSQHLQLYDIHVTGYAYELDRKEQTVKGHLNPHSHPPRRTSRLCFAWMTKFPLS